MKMKEDEIEVLGSRKKIKWKWIFYIILFVGLLLCVAYFMQSEAEKKEVVNEVEIIPENGEKREEKISLSVDSINDVGLQIFSLHHLKAELFLELPSPEDTTLFFVLQAADVRKDNGEILGDFVWKGKQLARGKRKPGFCTIVDGKLSIGRCLDEKILADCVEKDGYFFRQYALVWEGEMQENRLKGKAFRRALAQQGDDFYIVLTTRRESLYDFSEALVDMGFTNAIYLVGGSSYGWYRLDGRLYELGQKEAYPLPNTTYLVFRTSP